jgi:hypothetical protein
VSGTWLIVNACVKKIRNGIKLILNINVNAQRNGDRLILNIILNIYVNTQRNGGKNNRDISNAYQARRRAAKKSALMPWIDVNVIKNFYTEARRLTKLTGVKHHVDHIYPLQSEYMCGLHVETNLQILTEKENILKGNRTWPGQLECQKGNDWIRYG